MSRAAGVPLALDEMALQTSALIRGPCSAPAEHPRVQEQSRPVGQAVHAWLLAGPERPFTGAPRLRPAE